MEDNLTEEKTKESDENSDLDDDQKDQSSKRSKHSKKNKSKHSKKHKHKHRKRKHKRKSSSRSRSRSSSRSRSKSPTNSDVDDDSKLDTSCFENDDIESFKLSKSLPGSPNVASNNKEDNAASPVNTQNTKDGSESPPFYSEQDLLEREGKIPIAESPTVEDVLMNKFNMKQQDESKSTSEDQEEKNLQSPVNNAESSTDTIEKADKNDKIDNDGKINDHDSKPNENSKTRSWTTSPKSSKRRSESRSESKSKNPKNKRSRKSSSRSSSSEKKKSRKKSRSRSVSSRSRSRSPKNKNRNGSQDRRQNRSKDQRRSTSKDHKRSRSRDRKQSRSRDRRRSKSKDRRNRSRDRHRSRSTSRNRKSYRTSPKRNTSSYNRRDGRRYSNRRSRSPSPRRWSSRKSRSRSRSPRGRYRGRSRSPRNRGYRGRSRSRSKSHSRRSRSRSYSSRRRRTRSRSRSRSRDRSKRRSRSKSTESNNDKKDNNNTNKTTLPTASTSAKDLVGKAPTISDPSNKKSLEMLTEFCKKLTEARGITENEEGEGNEEENEEEEEEDDVVISHPFLVAPKKDITIPQVIFPVKPILPPINMVDSSKPLTEQFPVSCGTKHHEKEHDDTAVSTVPNVDGSAIMAPPPPLIPQPVFQQPQEKLDIASLVVKRMDAQRKLKSNPNDIDAMLALQEIEHKLNSWCQSNVKPGQFTGHMAKQMMPKEKINAGYQAWAKKDMFHNLNPVTGGIGMKLLQKMGWEPGQVIGKSGKGLVEPIALTVKVDRKGLSSTFEKPSGKKGGIPVPTIQTTNQPGVLDLQGKHPISMLQEICARRKWNPPDFTLIFDEGPPHSKQFLFKVLVDGYEYQHPVVSGNKKHAKAQAAVAALKGLGLVPPNAQF